MQLKKTALALILIILSFSSYAQTSIQPSGTGDISDPYLIRSLENLYWLTVSNYTTNNFSHGKYFNQINNINASATANWPTKWIPIGGKSSATVSVDSNNLNTFQFQGSYNGNGFYIDGITVNNTDSSNHFNGFFGKVTGTIINLKLTNLSITTNSQKTGGLAGNNRGYIYNCSTSGTITSTSVTVGGLLGQNGSGAIFNSYSTCAVTGQSNAIGAFLGLNQKYIYDCYSKGSATGTATGAYVGGLVGEINSNSNHCRSYANSTIDVPINSYGAGLISKIGSSSSVPTYNYWNSDLFTNGYGINSGIFSATSLTSLQLKVRSNFDSWDFVNTWGFGSDGYPTLLNKPNTWLGVNTNWSDVTNWSLGVPSGNELSAVIPSSTISFSAKNLVYIPAGLSNYPVLTAPATAYSVTIANGASINLNGFSITKSFYFQQAGPNSCIWTGTTNTSWNISTNWNPQAIPSINSEVVIPNTTNKPSSTNAIEIAKLTLDAGATLSIQPTHTLKVNGDIVNNGQIIFKSNATGSGLFDTFTGTVTGIGSAQVERYIPAKRAYRFLSPSVTTSTKIRDNWQENGGTTEGLGTHITGLNGSTNGFDSTTTNYSSLFSFDHTNGVWAAVTNTTSNTLSAGTAYRLMVRGDRTISLATNSPSATNTTLRATGVLKTGNFSPTLNQASEGYSFVGNPYQAPVDIKAILATSTNMNSGVVYYWDPTLNDRGAYVTRDLTSNQNSVTSNFNEYLQPGQAVFVKKAATSSGASMLFTESNKSIANSAEGVFRTTENFGTLRTNLRASINNQWTTIEGTLAVFNPMYSWEVTQDDAIKFSNLDEEVSFVQNNKALAIACQPNPSITDELPIKINNIRHSNYQWQFDLTNYDGATPYLFDALNNTFTIITDGIIVPFTVDTNTANRFKIVFQNATLNNPEFATNIVMYPNPARRSSSFVLQGVSKQSSVVMYNTLGQTIAVNSSENESGLQVTPKALINSGVYIINIISEGKTSQVKWIVE